MNKKNLLFFLAFLISSYSIHAQIFVNTNASGLNDGTSWENAFTHLQEAIDSATNDSEIWIASGTIFL